MTGASTVANTIIKNGFASITDPATLIDRTGLILMILKIPRIDGRTHAIFGSSCN
jgi:hypothetical protein